ncbi:MAG: hypothetical protein HW418_3574 [Anaerolineales bacterium]|nr:hypothetical protein [Anaerolineales bacterium]
MRKLFTALVLVALLSTAAAPVFADTVYVVQPGDTLFKISLKPATRSSKSRSSST